MIALLLFVAVPLAVVALVLGVIAIRRKPEDRDELRRVGDDPETDVGTATRSAGGRSSWMRPSGF